MIHLYHKNRLRFSDPRGSWLRHFEKPIGRNEKIQGKDENKNQTSHLNDMSTKPDFLALNISLHPLLESAPTSENLTEKLPCQTLDNKINRTA